MSSFRVKYAKLSAAPKRKAVTRKRKTGALVTRRRAAYKPKRKMAYRKKRYIKKRGYHAQVKKLGMDGIQDRALQTMVLNNHCNVSMSTTGCQSAYVVSNTIFNAMTGWYAPSLAKPAGFTEAFEDHDVCNVMASQITLNIVSQNTTNNTEVQGVIIPCRVNELADLQTATNIIQLQQLPHARRFNVKVDGAGITRVSSYARTSQIFFGDNRKHDINLNNNFATSSAGQPANATYWFVALQNLISGTSTIAMDCKVKFYCEFFSKRQDNYLLLKPIDRFGNEDTDEIERRKRKLLEKKTASLPLMSISEPEYELIKVPKLKTPVPLSRT